MNGSFALVNTSHVVHEPLPGQFGRNGLIFRRHEPVMTSRRLDVVAGEGIEHVRLRDDRCAQIAHHEFVFMRAPIDVDDLLRPAIANLNQVQITSVVDLVYEGATGQRDTQPVLREVAEMKLQANPGNAYRFVANLAAAQGATDGQPTRVRGVATTFRRASSGVDAGRRGRRARAA